MKENLGELQGPGIIERYKKFIFGQSEASEDIEAFLAHGKIEQLVREGRTPLKIGEMGALNESSKKFDMKPLYEVPPVGFAGKDMKEIFGSQGVHVFINKLGIKRLGSTFMLTAEQVEEVESRIRVENKRLGKTSDAQK